MDTLQIAVRWTTGIIQGVLMDFPDLSDYQAVGVGQL